MNQLERLLDISDYMVTFVRVAITGVSENVEIPDDFDWNALYTLSEWHKLTVVVWKGVEMTGLKVPAPLYDKWYVRTQQALSKSIRFEHELRQIQTAFSKAGIDHVLLKGVTLQKYWPANFLREFSDHDILIRAEHRETARNVMLSLGYYNDHFGGVHDVYKKEPIYDVEIHVGLFEDVYDYAVFFQDVWNRVVLTNESLRQFSFASVDFYLYFLLHFIKHEKYMGSGLRFYIDLYVLRNQLVFSKDEQREITSVLSTFGLLKYVEGFFEITDSLFIDKKTIPAQMKELIFAGSVYGGHTQSIYNSMHRYGTVRYVFRRLFPPRRELVHKYKFLEAYPFLLPAVWVYRLIHRFISGFHRKRIFREIRAVKRFSGKEVKK